MEHVVFYQSAQGTPSFRRVASLEDAVSFAEHLRNVEGVAEFSVFALSPVTLSTRAYYHVEVAAGDAAAAPAPVAAPAPTGPPPLPPEAPPFGSSLDTSATTPAMSFHALEEEATAPLDQLPAPVANVPFAAAPLPPPTGASPITETFVKDGPADLSPSAEAEPAALDPTVVDPTVEEVAPSAPSGRRSMGFFARS